MIAMLTGPLVSYQNNRGILDVNGVGYEVFATATTLASWEGMGSICAHISTQVREDAITLYGFTDDAERACFLALLSVSGVGPKVALAALDCMGPDGLAEAVSNDNISALCKISGVGKKTAQRLALELKGKLTMSFTPTTKRVASSPADPLPLALAQLGYKKSEIDTALNGLDAAGISRDSDTGERLRAALKLLSGNR